MQILLQMPASTVLKKGNNESDYPQRRNSGPANRFKAMAAENYFDQGIFETYNQGDETPKKGEQRIMTREELLNLHKTLTETARELMSRKNADYGANTDPFANFRMSQLLHIQPEFGILLRMQDKMARLVSFIEKGNLQVKEESWRDSIIDLVNYSVLLCGLLHEKKEVNALPKWEYK